MSGAILVVSGPNLNLLGEREPDIYGRETLNDVEAMCRAELAEGYSLDFRQTNTEHEMVDWIQQARKDYAGIVINPAAFSYSAYSVLDAIKLVNCPVIEVHLSNIHRRETEWRSRSIMTQAVAGIISGFGVHGYALAVRHVIWLKERSK